MDIYMYNMDIILNNCHGLLETLSGQLVIFKIDSFRPCGLPTFRWYSFNSFKASSNLRSLISNYATNISFPPPPKAHAPQLLSFVPLFVQ